MTFKDIIGQEEMQQRLRKLADENRLPHAIMLCGPEGCGKMALAISLASYVLGTDRWQHPDLHYSYPLIKPKSWTSDRKPDSDDFAEEWFQMLDEEGAYFSLQGWLDRIKVENQQSIISVAESDRLTKKLMMKSNQGGKKISIIWLPEKMNQECANKILKLLEEPPSETHFILVSVHPELLLDTIRSRVQRFDVKPIAAEDVRQALMERRGLTEEDATRTARLAGGNWLKAIMLLTPGNEEVQFFDFYVMLMRKAYMRDVKDLKKWTEQVAMLGREKQLRLLHQFVHLTREFFMYNFHNPSLVYLTQEEEEFAVRFAKYVNEHNVIAMYELFQRAIRDIGQNANPKILFFDVAMRMAVMIRR